MNTYDIGTSVTLSARFVDTAGRPTDPGSVHCTLQAPGSPTVRYVYGTDSELTRSGVGAYSVVVETNEEGDWLYRWAATGAGATAADGGFKVSPSQLFPP